MALRTAFPSVLPFAAAVRRNRCSAFLFTFLLLLLPISPGAGALPEELPGSKGLRLTGGPRVFEPEQMYEHVNGEAELLKRFGASSLTYAVWEGPGGASVTVDAVEVGDAQGAFGLYRLYTGCEETLVEEEVPGGRLHSAGTAAYAWTGRHFLRISAHVIPDPLSAYRRVAAAFVSEGAPPRELALLEARAARRCDVRYFPDAVDPRLDGVGPGFRWVTRGGKDAFLSLFPTREAAAELGRRLAKAGTAAVAVGRRVAWIRGGLEGEAAELGGLLRELPDP